MDDSKNAVKVQRDPKTGQFLSKSGKSGVRKQSREAAIAKFRVVFDEEMTTDDWRAIIRIQKNLARKGSIKAASWLRDTGLGKPRVMKSTGDSGGEEFMRLLAAVLQAQQQPVEPVEPVIVVNESERSSVDYAKGETNDSA